MKLTVCNRICRRGLRVFVLTPSLLCAVFSPLQGANLRAVPEFQAFVDKAARGESITVAYLGGSITLGASAFPAIGTDASGEAYDCTKFDKETDSWRALTFEWLRSRYEKTPGQFRQVNSAIGGTPSLLGAYRLEQDVLGSRPDLVFVEFAVNDNGVSTLTLDNPGAPKSILRTCCSIVGRLRSQNPHVAIFMPLSTHRILAGSAFTWWDKALDLGHDQTLLAAEMLHVPYVSIKEAFYANAGNPETGRHYLGPDNAGNYVHPAPFGHQTYAKAVETALSDVFQSGTFRFKQTVEIVPPYPVCPQLVLPETLLPHASGWKMETRATAAATILEGDSYLLSDSIGGVLEYTFSGSAVGLWCDNLSRGGMEVILDGKKLELYVNRVSRKGKFSGQFCNLADSLDRSGTHTLQLIPISLPDAENPRIMLRALTIDAESP